MGDAGTHLLLYQGVDAVPGTLDAAAVLWPIHVQGLEVKPAAAPPMRTKMMMMMMTVKTSEA